VRGTGRLWREQKTEEPTRPSFVDGGTEVFLTQMPADDNDDDDNALLAVLPVRRRDAVTVSFERGPRGPTKKPRGAEAFLLGTSGVDYRIIGTSAAVGWGVRIMCASRKQ